MSMSVSQRSHSVAGTGIEGMMKKGIGMRRLTVHYLLVMMVASAVSAMVIEFELKVGMVEVKVQKMVVLRPILTELVSRDTGLGLSSKCLPLPPPWQLVIVLIYMDIVC